ncbi:MAG: DUF4153 domain-containing protein [Firmicutes bacterium]|nr:DUF4153 domain-containing protein [Bacillota bacterium]
MAKNILVLIRNNSAKLAASLKRFPEPLLSATGVVVTLIVLNHLQAPVPKATSDFLSRLAMTLALGVPLSLSLRVLYERFPGLPRIVRLSLYPIAAAGLILYFFFLLPDFKALPLIRYTAVTLSLYLAFLFIPYFYKRDRFELYAIRLFTNFAVTCLYSIILFGGLAAILFTLDKLFGAKVAKLYLDFWLAAAGVFAPAFFLAGVPERSRELQTEAYPKVFRILLSYIVIPVIIIYSTILYLYFGKIIITRQWPTGIVANLVLWYAIISTVVVFFITPLRGLDKWTGWFLTMAPKFVLPPMIMMFVAIGIRVRAYGVTENRYFIILAGLWVTGCLLYLIFAPPPKKTIILPVTAALLALASITGPWSCGAISQQSQSARLEKILKKHRMLQAGMIIKPLRQLPQAAQKEISSILVYFQRYHGFRELKYLPKNFELKQMPQVFGFACQNEDFPRTGGKFISQDFTNNGVVLNIQDYDYFIGFTDSKPSLQPPQGGPILVSYSPQSRDLTVRSGGKELYRQNTGKLAEKLLKSSEEGAPLPPEKMRLLDQNEQLQALYVFKQINGGRNSETNELTIDYLEFYLFIRLKSN